MNAPVNQETEGAIIKAFCERTGSGLIGKDLFVALTGDDDDPAEQARLLLARASQIIEKRGRVLSAANEGKIRTAKDHLDNVLSQLERQPAAADDDDEDGKALRLILDSAQILTLDDEDVLTLDLDPIDEFDISTADLTAALQGVLRETVGVLVTEQTRIALDRARGRVD